MCAQGLSLATCHLQETGDTYGHKEAKQSTIRQGGYSASMKKSESDEDSDFD